MCRALSETEPHHHGGKKLIIPCPLKLIAFILTLLSGLEFLSSRGDVKRQATLSPSPPVGRGRPESTDERHAV